MKKLLLSLFLLSLTFLGIQQTRAMSYGEALDNKKPSAVLVYADWADNMDKIMPAYNNMQQQFGNKYNFVLINIANAETKEFNKKNYIYPNLPYMLLFKDRGRVSRFIPQDCITDESCIRDKIDLFAN